MNVDSIQSINAFETLPDINAPKSKREDEGFSNVLAEVVTEVNDLQKASGQAFKDFVAGDVKDLHQVMTAMGKADIAFRYALEVRNKLMEAYKEVMHMRV